MIRDVIKESSDLSQVEQQLNDLVKATSLENLIGQYLPPLIPVDLVSEPNSRANLNLLKTNSPLSRSF
jgi:hypothetical protein